MSGRSSAPFRWSDRRLAVIAMLLAAVIFVADLSAPLGYSIGAFYGIVVLLGLFAQTPRFTWWAAAGVTALTFADIPLSPAGGYLQIGIVNRVLTIVGIWVTAWLVTRYGSTGRALDRSIKDLADTTFALDQAAIVAVTDVKGRINAVNDKFC